MKLVRIDFKEFERRARTLVGKPYVFGAEVKKGEEPKALDCSELVEFLFCEFGAPMSDGARYQYRFNTIELDPGEKPYPGDLGFFAHVNKATADNPHGITHVGILLSKDEVIEARGKPINKVTVTDRREWETYSGFIGWRKVKGVEFVYPNGLTVRCGV